MFSITHNFKIEAENILKKVTNKFIFEDQEFFNPIFNFNTLSIFLRDKVRKIIRKILTEAIKLIDENYANSEERKHEFYKSKKISRTVIKDFGEFTYERYYYVDKNKKNGFFYIDQLFEIEKYKTYDALVRGILIDHSAKNNVNATSKIYDLIFLNLKDYLRDNSTTKIPRQTIYSWIKKWNIPKVEYKYIEGVKKLYVMVDEKWIHEQIRLSLLSDEEKKKHHYIMSKCFVTFTGAKTKNKRTTLLNRHIFMTTSDNPWRDFIDEIYNIYNFEEIEEIYLLSDAGSWILAGKNELKLFKNNKVISNICEYHVKEYINRFVREDEKRKDLIKLIYHEKNKDGFIKLADDIIGKVNDEKKKETKTKYKNYVINHWDGILNMMDREVRSSMESHISHCVAASFGSRPKGYSKENFETYIKIEECVQNNINILDLYLNSFNKNANENYVYNEKDISLSIFENNISNIPIKSSTSEIANIIGRIAYGY